MGQDSTHPPPARRPLGRRAVFLAMFGTIYAALGVTISAWPTPRFTELGTVGTVLDSPWWGAMWLLAGLTAVGVASRSVITRSRDDGVGFVALLVPPALWTVFYAAAVVVRLTTPNVDGPPRSLTAVVVWSLAWSVVLLVSGWPDPDDTRSASTGKR